MWVLELRHEHELTLNALTGDAAQTLVLELTPALINTQQAAGGNDGIVSKTALQAIGGHRAVYQLNVDDVGLFSAINAAHYNKLLGISTQAANLGAPILVQTGGEISEPSWAWQAGDDIFVGDNGQLLQSTDPANDVRFNSFTFLQRVGVALSATSMRVQISEPILFY